MASKVRSSTRRTSAAAEGSLENAAYDCKRSAHAKAKATLASRGRFVNRE